ncbi:helicase and polymerase-containing protein TEBICHI isoform X2 [Asparagus officinalis]|uniref:helicase and polymerase-containing protein TEBICHI isoform X2 n=1 Tax=Asparagus officinalis TaxID=4686 RepID=UPI00098E314A|nr:helicase and polymerase-containing protein TEBICHI isoform X2 [Asparagus officinalis]
MSSSSPRSRIDQFYASRKRKPSSSSSKAPKSPTHGSTPSPVKGSLDTYLVKSPRDATGQNPIVKRNLTKEIHLSLPSSLMSRGCSISKEEEEKAVENVGQNSELKKFAADFLSLYCSDLPSAVNAEPEIEPKGQKRNGSPTLLLACNKTCGKKHCLLDQPNSAQELEDASSSKDRVVETLKTEQNNQELACKISGESDGGRIGCMSLRKCSHTPNSSLSKKDLVATETPKSVSRRSMFSPGDEFWDEAIQVADGFFVPADEMVIKDESSCVAPLNHCAKPIEKDVDGTGILSESVNHNNGSPLPVKHFDFSREDNTVVESTSHCRVKEVVPVTGLENKSADRASLRQNGFQASDVEALREQQICSPKSKSSSASLLSEKLGQVIESDLGLVANKRRSGVSTQTNDAEHMQNDKIPSSCLPVTGCNAATEAKSFRCRPANVIYEEARTPSSIPLKDQLQLSCWLPSEVCSIYMKKGISKLYPWQVDCLLVDGVLEKRNLVYSASTSAGKSFVAEILMLRRVISTEKMALLVLPYVSICAEKAEHLEVLLEPLGKHVRSFYGSQGGRSLPKDTSVAVCTIEKANSLINRLLEEGRLSELGIIVIDELHMVGDQHRGYLLELMLTKLRYAAGEGNSESISGDSSGSSSGRADPSHGLQIVGMSATMPNVTSVANWLQAALYETDFRPVPLEEYIKVGHNIFDKKMDIVRMMPKSAEIGGKDPDHIVELCNEVVQEGHSVLLFCSSRKGCESTARHVSRFLKKFSLGIHTVDCEYNDACSALEALRRCPAGLDPVLEETVPCGVAYHHAGLTVEEREIIETCYRKGIIRVLTATSTLAAGVNLPARRVIFRQPRIGRDFIDGTRYRQMAGRAGRTGIDTKGESVLICKPEEVKKIMSILNDSCPSLQSCLSEDKNGMTHAILEVVAGGIVQTASDIHRYVRCTLLNSTKPFEEVVKSAQDSLRWLCHKKFLEWNDETRLYSTTPLGRAAFGSSLTPEESLVVIDDLSRAREGFVLASDLHLVYLVTPINVEVEPDWELYYERFLELAPIDQSVGNRVGVAEPFLMRMAHGAPPLAKARLRGKKSGLGDNLQNRITANDNAYIGNEQTLRVCRRFYVALMLSRLVQEVPVADVCEAFKVARGMVQSLQENAGRFALMVSIFCERLGWHDFEGLISKFQNRVSFGVRAEIVELTTIPHVKGSRARALYKAGLRTPLSIAEASIPEIANALFESSLRAGQEGSAMRRVQMGVAKKIKNGARKIVLDQAEEARIAAFSAFKSLGVEIPKMSRPLLAGAAGDSPPRGDDTADENPQVAPSIADNGRYMVPNDRSNEVKREEFTMSMKVKATKGVSSVGGERDTCNSPVDRSLVAPSSTTTFPPDNLHNIVKKTSQATCSMKASAGFTDKLLDKKLAFGYMKSDNGRQNESDYSNNKVNDQGPTNASNYPGGFDSFLDHWESEKEFYFDLHFSNRSALNSQFLFEVFGLAICWENSPVYYINLSKDLASSAKQTTSHATSKSSAIDHNICEVWDFARNRWNRIAKIMSRNGVRKVTWNLKSQIQVLKFPCISSQRLGRLTVNHTELNSMKLVDGSFVSLPPISVHGGIDTCLVAWILWPDEESKYSPNLEKVVKKRLSSEAAAAANQNGRWRNQMRKAAHDGCCRRVAQSRALGSFLWKLLISENLVEALIKIENPLVKVLADMEFWGIGVDMEGCLRARHILVKKLKELEKEAHTLAGMSFSLNTSADIANVLYTQLMLPIPQNCKKGKLHPSTGKHSLDILRGQHPIVSVIREHRTLAKLNSTLGSICSRARLCTKTQKYIVQGHWLQSSTATGRLSMEEPNLQTVEHLVVFTTDQLEHSPSRNKEHHQINARDFFIPTQENWLLLTADYSQIELRLMAHFSKDSSLIELLSKPDGDCFTMIAAKWTALKKLQERFKILKLLSLAFLHGCVRLLLLAAIRDTLKP